MSLKARIAAAATAALLVATFALTPMGCGGKSSTSPPPGAASTTVTGVVKDAVSGSALVGASVKASTGGTATTDANGQFSIAIGVNQSVRLDVTQTDYSLNQVVLQLGAGETRALNVSLMAAGTTTSVVTAAGGTVTDANSGATLSLPADFVTASGSVSVTVTGLDPTSPEVRALPGGLEAVDAGGQPVYLQPVSFAEYTVKDASGNVLQFNPSASAGADIELPIPASLQGQPGYENGDPIECYVYDPADGKWKTPVPGIIGPSSVDGTPAIKATIFHLSWYGGAPASSDVACVEGTVSLNGSPVANVDVEAFPGGNTRTDASGHYQVQAAANSSVRVAASLYGSGTFRSAEGTVNTGGPGVCAHLDLSLGAATAGEYTVQATISRDPVGPTDIASVLLQLGTGITQVPVNGAKVQVGTGGTWFDLTEAGSGYYYAYTGLNAFALTPGLVYTLRCDFDDDLTFDATGTVRMVGTPIVTTPAAAASVGASFTATWTDAGTSAGGYSANYLGYISDATTYANIFATTSLSKLIGNGVTDPVTQLPNPPLTAGSYTINLIASNGPTYSSIFTGTPPVPNVTGTNVTGNFDALSSGPEVSFTSTGLTSQGVAVARGVRSRTPAAALAAVKRVREMAKVAASRASVAQRRR